MPAWRRSLPLVAWLVALLLGLAVFHGLGAGPIAAPPLTDPGAWGAWAADRDPRVATVAVLRLVVLALAWYLVGVTTVGLLARLLRAARLVRVADALTIPMVRRLLQGALGVGLATAMVGAATVPAPVAGARTGSEPAAATALDEQSDADHGHVTLVRADAAPGGSAPPAASGDPASSAAADLTMVRAGSGGQGGVGAGGEAGGGDGEGTAPPRSGPLSMRLLDQAADDGADEPSGASEEHAAELTLRALADPEADAEAPAPEAPAPAPVVDADAAPDGVSAVGSEAASGAMPAGAAGASDAGPDVLAQHRVRSGESLWSIAQDALAEAWEREPTDAEIHRYWDRLIEQNRAELADPDNPDLIFPGDALALPPLDGQG